MRQTDYSQIPMERRSFINSQEWDIDESRSFYNTGFEKIEKISKAGKTYCQYLYYLLPIKKEGIGEEETLGLFSGQAVELKKSALYQKVTIQKVSTEKGEDWNITLGKEILAEKDRPPVSDYPEMTPYINKKDRKIDDSAEINIDDIPF